MVYSSHGKRFRRGIKTVYSQAIDSEAEDDDQEQYSVTTPEISTTEAIEAFNKVIAWS